MVLLLCMVLKAFVDLQDNNFVYHVGDEFPRNGAKVSAKRLEELSTNKNRRGIPIIEKIGEDKKEDEKKEVVEESVVEANEEAPKKRSRKKKENVENAN